MRDRKGIKILLAICLFSHRDKDFLPQQEVFWNLRLNHVVSANPKLSIQSSHPVPYIPSLPLSNHESVLYVPVSYLEIGSFVLYFRFYI